MKNLKKLTRKDLYQINGAGNCTGCPAGGYGPGGASNGFDHSCEDYNVLPGRCKSCVFVSVDCINSNPQ